MGESYNNASEMELILPNNDNDGSIEDQKEKIRILTEELREELILSNSLTNIIAEKSSEIDYLKNKVEEQDGKIRNLEDQIEEWTNQSEACDKVLEQKDCEIEMLKKTLNIEKQQRRDLEDMTMEVGKENIKERELLEKKIEELQGRILRMEEENKKGKVEATLSLTPTNIQVETANEGKTLDIKNVETPVKEENSKELDSQLNEEYKADMEVLMNDLFVLIKKNEELKEEVEKLKKEQVSILEDKRSVVTDLETTLEEKSAEIQHQKHEIRMLSSAVEVGDTTTDIEKYNQAKQLRREFEDKIEHLESTNSEMKNILEENEAAKDTLARQLQKTKKKLQMEREQNTELNKQILEVSTLYDTFYSRCEELEKGRVKGLSGLRKDAAVPANDKNTNNDALTEENAGDKDDANNESIAYDAIETNDKDIGNRDFGDSMSSVVDPKIDYPWTETSTKSLDKDDSPESKMSCSGDDLASSPGQEKKGKKNLSKKKRAKLKKQVSSEIKVEYSRPRWSELFLSLSTSLFKILLLVATTFVAVSTMHVHFGVSIVNAFAGMLVAYFAFINIWGILSPQRQLHHENGATVHPASTTRTLRRAMQDLIMRLGDDDFKQFSETYEKYIDQTFAEEQASLSGNLKDEVIYLTATKDVLSKELAKYKEQNHSIHITYEEMKADIERFRAKRAEEEEEKDKIIRSLKEEISSLEGNLKKEGKSNKDKDERPTFKVNGVTYAKLLLFIILDVCVVLAVGNSAIVYPFLFLSALLISLVYRADMHLIQTLSINKGYQKTIQDLLCKVDEYKKEEKQISSEVKELEALVDKDYDIISKQRKAIERLERQLNRAINKYTEKKRTLGKVIWLQERNVENHSDSKSNILGEEYFGSFSESFSSEERSHRKSRSSKYSVWGAVAIAFLKFSAICLLGVAFSVLYGYYKGQIVAPDMKPYAYSIFVGLGILAFLWKWIGRKAHAPGNRNVRIFKELQQDSDMFRAQVGALREIVAAEREFSARQEKKVASLKEPASTRKIPKEEVAAVIDRLIEVSKQHDELKVEAATTKDKYDHVRNTLEDILSREKYLSEEVSSLRSQKRELQNDLMKEQIKHIELYEEVRKLKEISEKEDVSSEKSASRFGGDSSWGIDYIDEELISEKMIPQAANAPEAVMDDAVLDTLEGAGLQAQKSRGRRRGKKMNKRTEKAAESQMDPGYLGKDDSKVREPEWQQNRFEILTEGIENVKNLKHQEPEIKTGSISLSEYLPERPIEKEKEAVVDESNAEIITEEEVSKGGIMTRIDTDKQDQVPGSGSLELQKKLSHQEELLQAKEVELKQLKELLDVKNFNSLIENRNTTPNLEGQDTKGDKESELVAIADMEEVIGFLTAEISRLQEICDSDINMKNVGDNTSISTLNFLIEYVALFRYKISTEKAEKISKINVLEETMDEMQKHSKKLHFDLEKEKKARNHAIMEYEKEYERLETRLSEAYEAIRKRLMEERELRAEIMKQYEIEIEDMQSKTTRILQDLHVQLKHERKEKEEAENKIVILSKKSKILETDIKVMEENFQFHNDEVLIAKVGMENLETLSKDAEKIKRLVEEEADKRVNILKDKLEQATQSVEELKIKLEKKEDAISRLEKQALAYREKIGIQDQRMSDLENEVRSSGNEDEELWQGKGLRALKEGIIYNLATKNGNSKWRNPASVGIMQVSRSSAGFGSASDILDIKPKPCSTENLEDSWFQLDFGHDITVIPESYSLCHGWLSGDGCLRTWVLEGSLDASKWHTLKKHFMDTSLNDRYMIASWQLSKSHRPFRYLRIRITGPNSSNTNELYIGGLEIFGKTVHSAN